MHEPHSFARFAFDSPGVMTTWTIAPFELLDDGSDIHCCLKTGLPFPQASSVPTFASNDSPYFQE